MRPSLRRLVFILVVFAWSIPATALALEPGPEALVEFGSTGSGAGQTSNPRGVATDPATGRVYVADLGNRRIDEFTAWGEFIRGWGWGVANGSTALQTCTTSCQQGLSGNGVGQLSNALGVAVDDSGDIYVVDQTNRRVQKFNSAGEFLLMFGGGVDSTTGANVCTKAQVEAGDTCGPGTTGTGQGQFGAWKVGSYIAVGPGDTVYVGDNNRIQEFNPDGTFKSEIPLTGGGFVESLAIDPSGNLYVASEQSKIPGIRKLTGSGVVLGTITGAHNGKGEPVTIVPKALATDGSGNLYVVDDQVSSAITPEVFKFNATGEQKASFGEGEFTTSTGIGTNAVGDIYVTNATPSNSYVRAYGPLPTAIEPPPSTPPAIGAEFATAVGARSATVEAEINPHFFPTRYYVQYGTENCESSVCMEQPVAPGLLLAGERDKLYPTGGVSLGALVPNTSYHYRFVAVSDGGTTFGPDRILKTYQLGAFALPDDRGFELVSPLDKNGAEVALPNRAAGGVSNLSVQPLQASPDGEVVTYPSFTAFGGPQSAPAASQYVSRRGAEGWTTENITPPDSEGYTSDPLRGFASDLSIGVVIQREPTLAPGAVPGYENLYLRDASGAFRVLTTATPRVFGNETYCVAYAGASAGFQRVIFFANGALTPDAPEVPGFNLYEWSAAGLKLVSVLPGGAPAQPSTRTGFGAGRGLACEMGAKIVRHAISADGSRIVWTYGPPSGPTELLLRIDGTTTVQIDAPQGGSGPAGGGRFWAASDNGSKIFFTDENKLTSDSTATSGAPDLYEYDADTGVLSDRTVAGNPLEPAAVRGVLGVSEDGAYAYFVAAGALDGNAIPGGENLYVLHSGQAPRFIATLSGADQLDWSDRPKEQTARVTPDGRQLAFLSQASLTGSDNVDQVTGQPDSEAYLYDAGTEKLVCASCNPGGARPLGPTTVPTWSTPYEQARYLSDDGGRLFFQSLDALALRDTNGTQDVYEFERQGVGGCSSTSASFSEASEGCLFQVSTGTSGDATYLVDASSDGRDVFISTRQGLVPFDEDERFDVYDARMGGGFPVPPQPLAGCAGEACRAAQAPPATDVPASATLVGRGNVGASRRRHHRHCPRARRKGRLHSKRARCHKASSRHGRHQRSGGTAR